MKKTTSKSRSGTVLICVLACLGIVITLVMTTMQSSLRGRREVRMQRQLIQTELLCEAGVQRAVRQFGKSQEYQGETWHPKLGTRSFENAIVEIRLEPSKEDAQSKRVEVIATLATTAESQDRMQRSHVFTIGIPPSATLPPSATETK